MLDINIKEQLHGEHRYTPVAKVLREGLNTDVKRKEFKAFKENAQFMTLKETVSSDQLSPYLPVFYADQIVELGLRERIFANLFPAQSQDRSDHWVQRYGSKTEGAQIIAPGDTIKQSKAKMSTEIAYFAKIADLCMWDDEALDDFGGQLNTTTRAVAEATSKVYRREDQLAAHFLLSRTSNAHANTYDNYIEGPSCGHDMTSADILDAIKRAYISMTTKVVASLRFQPDTLLMTSDWFVELFDHPSIQFFRNTGRTDGPEFSGKLLSNWPYGIGNIQLIESGYWDKQGGDYIWTETPCTAYLLDSKNSLYSNTRTPLSFVNLRNEYRMEQGFRLAERIGWGMFRFDALRRIGPTRNYTLTNDISDIRVGVVDEVNEPGV